MIVVMYMFDRVKWNLWEKLGLNVRNEEICKISSTMWSVKSLKKKESVLIENFMWGYEISGIILVHYVFIYSSYSH